MDFLGSTLLVKASIRLPRKLFLSPGNRPSTKKPRKYSMPPIIYYYITKVIKIVKRRMYHLGE
jgi:hypothetical protein